MSNKSILKAALTDFVRRKSLALNAVMCTVTEVDPEDNTCYCVPVNGTAIIPDARLIAVGDKKGVLIVPKKDSLVVVSFLADNSAYVSMFSEVEEVQLNGDTFGGLPQIEVLIKQMNATEKKVNAIISTFNSHTHPYTNVSALAATSATLTTVSGTLQETERDKLENTTVKHGDGT